MKDVLVTNITNKDQTVIIIPKNEATVLNPKASVVIDTYDEAHSYLYKSYQRKGLKVTFVDNSEVKTKTSEKPKPQEIPAEEIPSTVEEKVDVIPDPLPEITDETKDEVKEATPVIEDKPKRRSKKSTKSSDNSDEKVQ